MEDKKYICPICGYDKLDEPPYGENGEPSFEICPCCGFEYGYDDFDQHYTFESYRANWLKKGAKWVDKDLKPNDWDLEKQLTNIEKLQFKENYSKMFSIVREEVNKLDPMGLAPGETTPIDEYDEEVEMILTNIESAKNYQDLSKNIKDIFNEMFDENFEEKLFYDCAKNIKIRTTKM